MAVRRVPLAALLFVSSLAPAFGQVPAAPAQPAAPAGEAETFIDADRPGFADTSTVIGKGWIQLEMGLQREFRGTTGSRERTLFVPILFRVGVSDNLELRIEGNSWTKVSHPDAAHSADVSGLAPFSAGFKYQLREVGGRQKPGVGIIGRVFPAWGTGDLRAHDVTGDARIAVNWDFAPRLSLNPNAGIGWYEGGERRFAAGLFAITLTYVPAARASVFVDIGLQTPETQGGRTGATIDGGVAYFPTHDIQLDVSAGTRAVGNTGPRPFVAAGVSLRTRVWGG